uniref:Protein kinase domain-containing protein n=1 Tax=viral metagenome TaxID=1070528 RepID=A0A6C0CNU4_9ZZZZ
MTDRKHPTADELSTAIQNRTFKLGSGAQGDVYKIQIGDTQCFYAAKTAVVVSNSNSIRMEGSILKFIKDKLGCNDYILCFTAVLEVNNKY